MGRRRRRLLGCIVATLATTSGVAGAQAPVAPSAPASSDEQTQRGRSAYLRGQRFARDEQWSDALAAFQEAAAARDAPVVQFNIGYCERALGRYVAARKTFQGVLGNTTGLDASAIADTKGYLDELDKLLVHVAVVLDPASATLTVDGRPLQPTAATDTYLGGVALAGVGAPLDKPSFTVVLDPGAHVFRAVRAGHQDAVVPRSYRAGDHATLDLHLDVLPATVAVKSEPAAAIVRVDAREVGVTPVEIQRAAGQYRLEVLLDHYDTYSATLDLAPGQRSDLTARLNLYRTPIYKTWWFWTGAAAVVAGGAVLTYFLTRPTPSAPPYEAGSSGWLVQAQSVRF